GRHGRPTDRDLGDAAGRGRNRHPARLRGRSGTDRTAWRPRPAGAARQGERYGTHICGAHARGPCSGGRGMTPFELHDPASIEEAIGLIDAHDPSVRPIAGGTALMLMMKAGVFRPKRLVSLRRLDAHFRRIAPGADGGLVIGAMTPLAAIER